LKVAAASAPEAKGRMFPSLQRLLKPRQPSTSARLLLVIRKFLYLILVRKQMFEVIENLFAEAIWFE